MVSEFYERALVVRLIRIFEDPKPPAIIKEVQFDNKQDELVEMANKPWHQLTRHDYSMYLLDLCYVELDQNLFNYIFPAILIRWWEGIKDQTGGPPCESDFYRSLDHGEVLAKMLSDDRRAEVMSWMADAYIDSVDSWGGHLSLEKPQYKPSHDWPADNLHGPLKFFNALGQSVAITDKILSRLSEVTTQGRAQWWLVFATGLIWDENASPFIAPWDAIKGGGGIYISITAASIFDHGFLAENLSAIRRLLDTNLLVNCLQQTEKILESTVHEIWVKGALQKLQQNPRRISSRIERLIKLLTQPDLDSPLKKPLNDPALEPDPYGLLEDLEFDDPI